MKKLSLAIAILAAAVVTAGPLTYHTSSLNNKRTVPSAIQSDFPAPTCPPDCAVPTPSRLPN